MRSATDNELLGCVGSDIFIEGTVTPLRVNRTSLW